MYLVSVLALVFALGSTLTVLGPGALAPADPLVLERVEVRRVKYGYGLSEFASPDTVRVAVEDCQYLGSRGVIVTEGSVLDCYVVDCQQAEHEPLSHRGLVADVAPQWGVGHQQAVIILW